MLDCISQRLGTLVAKTCLGLAALALNGQLVLGADHSRVDSWNPAGSQSLSDYVTLASSNFASSGNGELNDVLTNVSCGSCSCGNCGCGQNYSRLVCDSCCETAYESLHGPAKCWRPLTCDTFFSEGWNEAWAGGPAGQCGLTPRHGWLGAFEGNFYRLGLVNTTYQHNLNQPYGGDGYGADVAAFLPLSRRFEMYVNAPFVKSNGTLDPTQGYQSDFGDLQVAGSFLLSENEAATQLFTLGVNTPTGEPETGGGRSYINPRYSFWYNPCDAWVVRGGLGLVVPTNDASGQTVLNTAVAVGRYFTPHDVAFGDLVFYVNCAIDVPLEDAGPTTVGIGPGTRFQIVGDWYFLHYWQFSVSETQPYDYQMQTAIVKAW